VGEQVLVIFAGSMGLLDEVPVDKVTKFASDMVTHLSSEHAETVKEIVDTGKLSDELAAKLTDLINKYREQNKLSWQG
jgi:F-type H+-transporting ATPase subunit alpha